MAQSASAKNLIVAAAILVAVATLLVAVCGVASAQPASGNYDADGDGLIEVSNLEQLDAIRYDSDGDGNPDDDSDAEAYYAAFLLAGTERVCDNCNGYELVRPLDFDDPDSYASGAVNTEWTTRRGWLPMGAHIGDYWFNAIFDGNGHTISNLHINRESDQDSYEIGLFGVAGGSSVIRELGLVNADVTGNNNAHSAWGQNVGGLTGKNSGKISNSYATGKVSGSTNVGGLAGWNGGTIHGSYAAVRVSGVETGSSTVGGLVGENADGVISHSHAVGNVSGIGPVGGLAGLNDGTVRDSYATGSVSGTADVGGLAGRNQGTVHDSYATGSVSAEGFGGGSVGGLVGVNSGGVVSFSYATGNVSGDRDIGGLAGENDSEVSACYATGNVSGDDDVGGLVGDNDGTVSASYATGRVSGSENVGGLAGRNNGEVNASYATGAVLGNENAGGLAGRNGGTITNGFWDTQTAGQGTGVGYGDSTGVVGKTTAELESPTGYAGIYRGWNVDVDNADRDDDPVTGGDDLWDFGDSSQYPALKADFDDDGTATSQEFGEQTGTETTPTLPTVYDTDGDGLIEVSDLEQLDAIRYDLDGDGRPDDNSDGGTYHAAFPAAAPEAMCNNCNGYELARPLDFNDANSYASGAVDSEWTDGSGWRPIGASDKRFNAIFDGNEHTISNLYVIRAADPDNSGPAGFFGVVGDFGVIREIGVVNVNVTGNSEVGGLAGRNYGRVSKSYATGVVSGESSVGGLIGINSGTVGSSYAASDVSAASRGAGGLAGWNERVIHTSYATGNVSGNYGAGGLVGGSAGTISVSYATGSVSGDSNIGGLVGQGGGTISACYATGSVSGSWIVGGLTGQGGTIIISYATGEVAGDSQLGGLAGSADVFDSLWDTETSGQEWGDGFAGYTDALYLAMIQWIAERLGPRLTSARIDTLELAFSEASGPDPTIAQGKTTAELQSPTDYTGIYRGWNIDLDNADGDFDDSTGTDDSWDFGGGSQYPALKADIDGDGIATSWEFGGQGREMPSPEPVPVPTPGRTPGSKATGPKEPDQDGDGLIEVSNLEQLDAIRYDLDGDGQPDNQFGADAYFAAFPAAATGAVCNRCGGYELARPLDFHDPGSYASGAVKAGWTAGSGWLPIGRGRVFSDSVEIPFDTTFDGNGHAISNLFINRTLDFNDAGAAGLFGIAGDSSVIRKIGLVDVDVTGNSYVGGLAGANHGIVAASYSAGDVSGSSPNDTDIGGLVGRNFGTIESSYSAGSVSGSRQTGGLAGTNDGKIIASHSTASVVGGDYVGGLAGMNRGTISAGYATGGVVGGSQVGGLAGENYEGTINASYATGRVLVFGEDIGGLAGRNAGTVTASFWDAQTSGQTTGIGARDTKGVDGKTTAELQSPTRYTGIYSDWNVDLDNADEDDDPTTGADDFWDFGDDSQYPVLKADIDGDGVATWQEFGHQGRIRSTPTTTSAQTPTITPTLEPAPVPTPKSTLEPTPMPAPAQEPAKTPPTTPMPVTPTSTPKPTATPRPPLATTVAAAADQPPALTPAAGSGGGACNSAAGPAPMGPAAVVSLLLLGAPLGMIGVLRLGTRRKRGGG